VRRGEQLSALGELVAGVAHEVRNPIFGIQITLETLEAALPPESGVGDLLAALKLWLERLNRLMESLLAYGRTAMMDVRPGSLSEVLDQALDVTRPLADEAGVRVRSEDVVSALILMDPLRLVHAFENLITNAIQHSPKNGEVVVSTRVVEGQVECSVRDFGPGFAPADLSRVWEPFFTRRRGGTGLGLAIVQRIIDEHGGTTVAANATDGGAVITVHLPIHRSSQI
jgi:signal transduction histidine kinase